MRKTKTAREAEGIARANFEKTARGVNEAEAAHKKASDVRTKAREAFDAADRQVEAARGAWINANVKFADATEEVRALF
jgi:hypothetical protein